MVDTTAASKSAGRTLATIGLSTTSTVRKTRRIDSTSCQYAIQEHRPKAARSAPKPSQMTAHWPSALATVVTVFTQSGWGSERTQLRVVPSSLLRVSNMPRWVSGLALRETVLGELTR